ncbi:helix-turn-helix transcriptional regulator [Pseudonocardia humida]|uniref:AAA family ATPase n=1 Tax=Pseudonocardia humida TaxID=2800819 RepID=A0ABT1A2Q2_9PSEU|nr:AAA family ATPase [Pseudonocardia humida]MCO1657298.1 AAA family ATPase [Pseudonocardia humida]
MQRPAVDLVERAGELAALYRALDAAAGGRGGTVLVEGPAGAGKTSLLRAAEAHAVRLGFATFRARAGELERDFAYGCVRQLLEPLVVGARGEERARLLAGAAAQAEALFGGATAPSTSPFATLHGLYWLLNNLAEQRPVALTVDDVQWADAESVRLLTYLAPRLDGLRLAVLVARRTGEPAPAELDRLALADETAVVGARPLSDDGVAELVRSRLDAPVAPEFAAACRAATGGNPFFLDALLREVRERGVAPDAAGAARVARVGPASVAHAALLRIAAAHPVATELVRALAVLGDGATPAEAAALAGVPAVDAVAAAEALERLGMLRAVAGLEFAHPIVREAVYADTGALRRRAMHADAARLLVAGGAGEERVAAQIVATEPVGDAQRVALLRRVAAAALGRGAPVAAEAWLRRAAAEPPPDADRAEVLFELGGAHLRLADPAAVAHLAEAAALAADPALRGRVVRLHALALTVAGRPAEAVAAIEAAVAEVAAADRELGLLLEADLAAHAHQAGPDAVAAAARRLERHADLPGTGPGERLVLASLAFERGRTAGTAAAAAGFVVPVLAAGWAASPGDLDVVGPFYHLLLTGLGAGAFDEVGRAIERELAEAGARGVVPGMAYATHYRGWSALRRGALGPAEADARASIDLVVSHGIPFGAGTVHGLLVQVLVAAGRTAEAEAEWAAAGLPDVLPSGLTDDVLVETRALLRLARGRVEDGVADLVEFGRRTGVTGSVHPSAHRWRSTAALALAAVGERAEARRLADEDLALARRWAAPAGIGVALRACAAAEGGAVERLAEAVDVLAASPARLEHALALVELGAALRRANRRTEARGPLQEGLSAAQACGAVALAEHAAVELRAAGGRSGDPDGRGVEQLTASERRIAELAAEGLSNPEIAQALYVTRKTVETHLGKVYLKLGIGGRTQLAGVLTGEP